MTEVAVAQDPLAKLDEDYEHAVIHLAADVHNKTKEVTLLCAAIELLPKEIPPPDTTRWKSMKATGVRRPFARRIVVPAARAVAWYQACAAGTCVLPMDSDELPATAHAKNVCTLRSLAEEPSWPAMTLCDRTIPGLADYMWSPRVHHLIATDFDVAGHWATDKERSAVEGFLQDEFAFEFATHRELYGSLHLIAPNPVFRSMEIRAGSDEGLRTFLIRIQPRAGRTLDGLRLIMRSRRPTGLGDFVNIPLEAPLTVVRLHSSVRQLGWYVVDARRGLLGHSSDNGIYGVTFATRIGFDRAMSVVVPPTASRPQGETYRAARRSADDIQMNVGKKRRLSPAIALLDEGRFRRDREATARADQRWFRDRLADATLALRDVIRSAEERAIIVDAYFGGTELMRFALAIEDPSVPVRILTGRKFLKQGTGPANPDRRAGHALADALASIRWQGHGNGIEIRVMRGKQPAIHDRFVVNDDTVWMLGSSLNEFGASGSMMLRVPDPGVLLADLEVVWDESRPLEDWLAAHTAGDPNA